MTGLQISCEPRGPLTTMPHLVVEHAARPGREGIFEDQPPQPPPGLGPEHVSHAKGVKSIGHAVPRTL
jgi:hypothetical protein